MTNRDASVASPLGKLSQPLAAVTEEVPAPQGRGELTGDLFRHGA